MVYQVRDSVNDGVVTLLREATKHRLTTLACIDVREHGSYCWLILCSRAYSTRAADIDEKLLLGSPSDWVQLSSLTWEMPSTVRFHGFKNWIQDSVKVLKNFRPSILQEVTVVFPFSRFRELVIEQLPSISKLCAELEETLVTFPQPAISFCHRFSYALNPRRYHSWMRMIELFFPRLAERHALGIDAEYCKY